MHIVHIVINRPVYNCVEPLEFALAMAAFDHDVHVYFGAESKALQVASSSDASGTASDSDINNDTAGDAVKCYNIKDPFKLVSSFEMYGIKVSRWNDGQLNVVSEAHLFTFL